MTRKTCAKCRDAGGFVEGPRVVVDGRSFRSQVPCDHGQAGTPKAAAHPTSIKDRGRYPTFNPAEVHSKLLHEKRVRKPKVRKVDYSDPDDERAIALPLGP